MWQAALAAAASLPADAGPPLPNRGSLVSSGCELAMNSGEPLVFSEFVCFYFSWWHPRASISCSGKYRTWPVFCTEVQKQRRGHNQLLTKCEYQSLPFNAFSCFPFH